jgi:hypothetical protein
VGAGRVLLSPVLRISSHIECAQTNVAEEFGFLSESVHLKNNGVTAQMTSEESRLVASREREEHWKRWGRTERKGMGNGPRGVQ